jgi:hypothetical protein
MLLRHGEKTQTTTPSMPFNREWTGGVLAVHEERCFLLRNHVKPDTRTAPWVARITG